MEAVRAVSSARAHVCGWCRPAWVQPAQYCPTCRAAEALVHPVRPEAKPGITSPRPVDPRYRAIGNSFAVPVVSWIGARIALVDQLITHDKGKDARCLSPMSTSSA